MAYGWEGEKVRLVPLDKEKHLANAVVWMNDPEVTAWTLAGDLPMTRLAEEQFFDEAMRTDPARITFAVETLAGDHVGFTGFHKIDYRDGVGLTGAIIGRKELWGTGLGTDTVKTRTRYAFDVLGLRLLLSEVMDGNRASIRMLESAGYREVGRIPRRYLKRGAYRDGLTLALERSSPIG